MELLTRYEGFEICRTSAGHIVVLPPDHEKTDRANLVELLGSAGMLDALFFPGIDDAVLAIDEALAAKAQING